MLVEEVSRALGRMCAYYFNEDYLDCGECPLNKLLQGARRSCYQLNIGTEEDTKLSQAMVNTILQWENNHPHIILKLGEQAFLIYAQECLFAKYIAKDASGDVFTFAEEPYLVLGKDQTISCWYADFGPMDEFISRNEKYFMWLEPNKSYKISDLLRQNKNNI